MWRYIKLLSHSCPYKASLPLLRPFKWGTLLSCFFIKTTSSQTKNVPKNSLRYINLIWKPKYYTSGIFDVPCTLSHLKCGGTLTFQHISTHPLKSFILLHTEGSGWHTFGIIISRELKVVEWANPFYISCTLVKYIGRGSW